LRPDDVALDVCIEDLKEALLDLKQATIARDRFLAADSILEITSLLAELQDRTG
jgi:hypothetical protein